MNLDNIKVDEFDVKFSEGSWSEVVSFADIINVIIEFIKKIITFEFAA